jgi:uncharacterized cofD-like protein
MSAEESGDPRRDDPDPDAETSIGPRGVGPVVVAVGGGHGQAASLRAARCYASSVTAVVSVADDGGSSGRLRQQLGIVPPGDLRKCLVALAVEGSALAAAFEHRFDMEDDELVGHALGNLVLAALTTTIGGVQGALDEVGRLLGASGRVLPATIEPVVLEAQSDGGWVEGQSAVAQTGRIRALRFLPVDPVVPDVVIEAIAAADQVIIGPGSLYTSVLAAAALPGVARAIAQGRGHRVYVANLRPQAAETEGYDVAAHVAALRSHGVVVDVVLADTEAMALGNIEAPVVTAALARPDGLAHDPVKLAFALADLVG